MGRCCSRLGQISALLTMAIRLDCAETIPAGQQAQYGEFSARPYQRNRHCVRTCTLYCGGGHSGGSFRSGQATQSGAIRSLTLKWKFCLFMCNFSVRNASMEPHRWHVYFWTIFAEREGKKRSTAADICWLSKLETFQEIIFRKHVGVLEGHDCV